VYDAMNKAFDVELEFNFKIKSPKTYADVKT
jgi:hypothetical protein